MGSRVLDRRAFVTRVGLMLTAPLIADLQQAAARVPRIGALWQSPPSAPTTIRVKEELKLGLEEHGYVEAKNVTIEHRYAELAQLPREANDLARLKVDLIVTGGTPATIAAKEATDTIPIVGGALADPVADGLVATLAKPGGNVTGNTFLAPSLGPKRLQLLKEVLPTVSSVAVLRHPGVYSERTMQGMLTDTQAAARAMGVQLRVFDATSADEFDRAFNAMTQAHVGALIVLPSPMFYGRAERLVGLAAAHRLPTIYYFPEAARVGGLMCYGADIPYLFRRAAAYVDKILKGTKPGDLPIEQPTKYDFIINLKAAKALGLTIPQSLLLRADQVIE